MRSVKNQKAKQNKSFVIRLSLILETSPLDGPRAGHPFRQVLGLDRVQKGLEFHRFLKVPTVPVREIHRPQFHHHRQRQVIGPESPDHQRLGWDCQDSKFENRVLFLLDEVDLITFMGFPRLFPFVAYTLLYRQIHLKEWRHLLEQEEVFFLLLIELKQPARRFDQEDPDILLRASHKERFACSILSKLLEI